MRNLIVGSMAIGICFGSSAAAQQAWVYKPFPRIPVGTVTSNPFVEHLRDACDLLAKESEIVAPQSDARARSAAEAPQTLRDLVKSAREEVKDTTSSRNTSAPLQALPPKAAALDLWIDALRETCRKLVGSGNLEQSDVTLLRSARDAPEALEAAIKIRTQVATRRASHPDTKVQTQRDDMRDAFERFAPLSSTDTPSAPGFAGLSDRLIRGMADFLVMRSKQEALRYLREELKSELCGEGKQWFPNMCAAIDSVDESKSLLAIGTFLRSAAEADLRRMPDFLLARAESSEPALAYTGRFGLSFFDAARSGRKPLEVLRDAGLLEEQACETASVTTTPKGCREIALGIRIAAAYLYALQQQNPNDWPSFYKDLQKEHVVLAAVALTLLVEKRFADISSLQGTQKFWTEAHTDQLVVARLRAPVVVWGAALNMHARWQALEHALQNGVDPVAERSRLAEALVQSIDGAAQTVQAANDLVLTIAPAATDTRKKLEEGMRTATVTLRAAGSIAAQVAMRDYGAAAIQLVALVPAATGADENKDKRAIPDRVRGLVPLVVEIAQSESSNDVAATLDAYAAPVGSYRAKFEGVRVSLNGMLGLFAGSEAVDEARGAGGLRVSDQQLSAGFFAPIGLHVTVGVGGWLHLGVLGSALDLGAVTAFRVGKEDALDTDMTDEDEPAEIDDAPELGFEQVFSPGLFFTVGLFRTPAIAGFGWEHSPALRTVRDDGVETQTSVDRIMFFLAIDVPIFTFEN